MDDDVVEVEQQPAGVDIPFVVVGQHAFMLQPVPDFVIDGGKLPLGLAAAQHEVVGEAADLANVQQNNVARLLVGGSLDRLARQF